MPKIMGLNDKSPPALRIPRGGGTPQLVQGLNQRLTEQLPVTVINIITQAIWIIEALDEVTGQRPLDELHPPNAVEIRLNELLCRMYDQIHQLLLSENAA
jgi:hypothetical protein